MTVTYKTWEFTPAEQQKFAAWVGRINVGHTGTRHMRNEHLNWTAVRKPLSECVVNLFTTGGVHRRSDQPFDVDRAHGDWSFREIPTDVKTADLTITHTHYNHVDADRDVNCMFPLDRLRELREQGVIGDIAPTAYTIMGFNPDPGPLVRQTIPQLAQRIQDSGADLLFMTCG
jgi:D-proline reductase (dithiol) PrdB